MCAEHSMRGGFNACTFAFEAVSLNHCLDGVNIAILHSCFNLSIATANQYSVNDIDALSPCYTSGVLVCKGSLDGVAHAGFGLCAKVGKVCLYFLCRSDKIAALVTDTLHHLIKKHWGEAMNSGSLQSFCADVLIILCVGVHDVSPVCVPFRPSVGLVSGAVTAPDGWPPQGPMVSKQTTLLQCGNRV